MTFTLHPKLEADTFFVADWTLSRVLLMNDARAPWIILLPRRDGIVEIFDLTPEERGALTEETAEAAQALKKLTGAAKINIGALGNVVPQFHMHVVARKEDDFAWPGPVWGKGEAVGYEPAAREALLAELVRSL